MEAVVMAWKFLMLITNLKVVYSQGVLLRRLLPTLAENKTVMVQELSDLNVEQIEYLRHNFCKTMGFNLYAWEEHHKMGNENAKKTKMQ